MKKPCDIIRKKRKAFDFKNKFNKIIDQKANISVNFNLIKYEFLIFVIYAE